MSVRQKRKVAIDSARMLHATSVSSAGRVPMPSGNVIDAPLRAASGLVPLISGTRPNGRYWAGLGAPRTTMVIGRTMLSTTTAAPRVRIAARDRTASPARVSIAIAGLVIVGMVGWSIVQWPVMEPSIITREAAGNHGTSVVPRLVTACAMPVTFALLTVFFWFAPRIDGRFLELLGAPGGTRTPNRDASPRVLGLLLIGLSVLLATLHVALISLHTPEQLPIGSLIPAAVGAMLVLLGIALRLIEPQAVTGMQVEARFILAQRRAYRRAAPLMVMLGVMTIIAAWLAPPAALPIAVGGVLVVFIGVGAFALVRAQAA